MTDFCSMFVSKVSFVKMFYFIRLSGLLLADRRGYLRTLGDTRISEYIRGYQDIQGYQDMIEHRDIPVV